MKNKECEKRSKKSYTLVSTWQNLLLVYYIEKYFFFCQPLFFGLHIACVLLQGQDQDESSNLAGQLTEAVLTMAGAVGEGTLC